MYVQMYMCIYVCVCVYIHHLYGQQSYGWHENPSVVANTLPQLRVIPCKNWIGPVILRTYQLRFASKESASSLAM